MHFFNPSGVDGEKILRIVGVEIFGGKILECTTWAKANTKGTTIFPHRKQVWNPAVWTCFLKFYQLENLEKAIKIEKNNISGHLPKKEYVNNFWIRIEERNRFPKLTSFWLHFILKEGSLTFTKGSPPRVAKFKAIIDKCTTFIPYSMYGFLQLITDGNQNKRPRQKEKPG